MFGNHHQIAGLVLILLALSVSAPALAQGRCAQPIARIVEVEGNISVLPASGVPPPTGPLTVPISASTQYELCAGEFIRAGLRSRASILLIATTQVINLNQNTTIRLVPDEAPQRTRINLLEGLIRLFNPIGRPLDVRTPYVTAGTEGTEFFVAYRGRSAGTSDACPGDIGDTAAGVTEGVIRISRVGFCEALAAGEAFAISADQAFLIPRTGPARALVIRPDDAVRWAIFYPAAVWTLSPGEERALDPHVAAAWNAWRNGDQAVFAAELNQVPLRGGALDARSLLRFAALLLAVGQVDEASEAILRADDLLSRTGLSGFLRAVAAQAGGDSPEAAEAISSLRCGELRSGSALALALCAITAVARNQTDEALEASARALASAPAAGDASSLIAAAVARSYALQSAFRLMEARAVLAPLASSGDPLVLARLAELDLSLGDAGSARREAGAASAIAPSLSLTSSILGFSSLGTYDLADAGAAFAKAATSDPGDPLPHLGLGLVAIRQGDLETGRREMVIATALDPESAVGRSYLGKTYAGLRLYEDAFRQWMLAETADPKDPTAPLYRAFAERALNRPADALADVNKSIALNDNRAVYRSRLLLDQDLAIRTTDLASVYRDLGFDQLAMSEAYRSVNVDPANPAAHRFLSDSYLSLPRHEAASDSELLQSLLLQPLNVQPIQPRLAREGLGILDLKGPSRVGFNEFSPLFASNGLSLLGDMFGGTQGTYGDNLVVSGIWRNFSVSLGQFFFDTDGIRANNQLRRDIEDGLVQVAVSDRLSILGEIRHSKLDGGDIFLFFDPDNFSLTSKITDERMLYRLGGRYDVTPELSVVGIWTHEHVAGINDNGFGLAVTTSSPENAGEGAIYFSSSAINIVAGGGYFDSPTRTRVTRSGRLLVSVNQATTHANGWVYANGSPIQNLELTLGLSFDQYRSFQIDRDTLNPKAGVSWELIPGSVLRAAYLETVKRPTIGATANTGGQTIEPTQVAGFNQIYDDTTASKTRQWGAGYDQKMGTGLFAGAEWFQRQLNVPLAIGPVPTRQYWREDVARVYLNWLLNDRFSVNLGLQWERFVRDPTARNPIGIADQDLLRAPAEVRFSDPSGFLAFVRATGIRETGHFFTNIRQQIVGGSQTFAVIDAGIGWRLPGRSLVGFLEAKNLLNTGFQFQDTDPTNPMIIPKRVIVGRMTWSF